MAKPPSEATLDNGRHVYASDGLPTLGGSPAGRYTLKKDVTVAMRDGTLLAVDLLLPEVPDPCPVVLARTPYNKVAARGNELYPYLARSGYVVALQDCRGRFNSDGDFDPYRQEHADGFDTVQWLSEQPYCDGNIGMVGRSYVGQAAWFAAAHAPKALKAIVPIASPPGHPFCNEPFFGGAMIMAMPEWVFAMGRRSAQVEGMRGLCTEPQGFAKKLPIAAMADAAGSNSEYWQRWLEHPCYDDFWKSCAYEQLWPDITTPALNITGWWDMNLPGAPTNFVGMRRFANSREAAAGQRLVIGPWPHWVNQRTSLNGVDFGPASVVDLNGFIRAFFDRWLRGREDALDHAKNVQIFVTGANQWWSADTWPLPETRYTNLYLGSGGRANSHRGNGYLSLDAPLEGSDGFESDPLDPIEVLWNLHDGPVDDRSVSIRPDVLCYTTEPLSEPVDVVGPISAVLFASSSATDCDWHVRLIDVHPNGEARFLCHGVLRSRFRESFEEPTLLQPDELTRFDIDMTVVGNRFLPGHRIRVEIASSWFSRFDRNPQSGAANWMTDTGDMVVAQQRVYHGGEYASYIRLPIIAAATGNDLIVRHCFPQFGT